MHGAALLLAPFLLAGGARPPDAAGAGAGALAQRLLRAPAAERLALLDRPEFASVEVARALLAVGEGLRVDADFRGAATAYQVAQAVARTAGAERERGQALNGAANALYRQGQIEPARRAAEESVSLHESLGDPGGQAEAWNTIGNIHHARGEYEEALPIALRVEGLWTAAGDRRGVARALNNTGNLRRARAEFDQASELYARALAIFEELADHRSEAVVLNNISIVHFARGEYPQALDYCRRGMAMAEALEDRAALGKGYDTLGNIYRGQGAYGQALEAFHRALGIRQAIRDVHGSAESWNNIGLVLFSQGDYGQAIDAYKRGLRIYSRLGGQSLQPESLANLAGAARRLGELRRAEANYRASLEASERVGQKGLAAANRHELGRIALEAGRQREAADLLERALTAREALRDQAGIAESMNALAQLHLSARRPRPALEVARRAAAIARSFEQPELEWEAETLAGRAHRSLGQADEARRSFEAAIRVIEGLRLEVGSAQGRERFFESKLSPYHELMALALSTGSDAEALSLAERSKARALADLMRGGRAPASGAMTDDERREEARLRGRLVSLNLQVLDERQRANPDASRLEALEADRRAKRAAYETFQAAVNARHPELRLQRGGAAPFRLAEAERVVPDASALVLEYVVTERETYLFVLTRENGVPILETHRLGTGLHSLAAQTRRLRERISARSLAFAEDARRLYDLLLAPARPRLRGRSHLVIVPDGPLWEVPFQALEDAAGRYVIESVAVSYAPSLTVLRETRSRPVRSGPPSLLAMGKADFGARRGRPGPVLMSGLGPLPDAERQVQAIAALYDPERRATWVGAEAREDRFKSEAPRHSILHLATHGVLDQASPLYSHVVLSPGSGGSSEDGLLEAWELLDLKLDASLVILSACETGRGRIAPGEGIVGTMWAFFVAGSRSLLVSQWKVEATSTTELMTAFHRGLAPSGGDKAAYLRDASLEVLHQPRYSHPFYWAGFVLVGDPY